jgi:hypothetical protein
MSNIFNLEGSQDIEAMATTSIEPMPTMRLRSWMRILEEEEWRQRLTLVVEEDQHQQLTIDENEPAEGTNIMVQVTQPHIANKPDNKLMPLRPPMVPCITTMGTQSIPGRDSGFQQVLSRFGPRLTNDTFTKRKLDWQQNGVADRSKQAPFMKKARRTLQSFGAFLIMHPQLGYVTCVHSAHVYHPMTGSPSELDGEVVAFIGDRTAKRMPIPVKLTPTSSFEFSQLEVVDDPCLMEDAYKKSGVTGTLWQPPGTVTKQPMMVPRMLAIPNIEFKILHPMGVQVIPRDHILHQ